jgi:TM2 domain-containing membrane protein YozV
MISASKIFFLFLIFCCNSINSQTELQKQFEYANSLYQKEDYFNAITEFKRLLFFAPDQSYTFLSNYLIASSYKAGGMFSDAIRYYTLAELSSRSLDDIFNCKIEIIKLNILRRTTDRANRLLDDLFSNNHYADRIDELHYWKGWNYIFSDQWDNASKEFYQIHPAHELYIFSQKINDSLYNETFARVLSFIIPGFGQFYSGEYMSGFLSLGWNALWGYLTINSFTEGRIFDGFAIANFLWLRFYNGNIYNSVKFVKDKNSSITNRALDYLQYEFDGPKP